MRLSQAQSQTKCPIDNVRIYARRMRVYVLDKIIQPDITVSVMPYQEKGHLCTHSEVERKLVDISYCQTKIMPGKMGKIGR